MAIDWDAIRRKGEEGLLTADEADALVRLAHREYEFGDGVVGRYDFNLRNWRSYCVYCGGELTDGHEHKPDCPIAILERTTAE